MTLKDYLLLPYPIVLRSDEDGDWVAEIEELEGCVAHGEIQSEALSRLEEAKALWIEEALSNGQPIPKPSPTEELPSGKWLQRIPRSLHKNLTRLAKIEGVSLNQLVATILSGHVGATSSRRAEEIESMWHELPIKAGTWIASGVTWPAQGFAYLRFLTEKLPDQVSEFKEEPRVHAAKR